MWDIQTGRSVRLLNGVGSGINTIQVSPGGRFCAGADYSGIIHIWDLGNSKKVTEIRPIQNDAGGLVNVASRSLGMIHSMAYSQCGSALAAAGDDGIVRIYDVRSDNLVDQPLITIPKKAFSSHHTLMMDLHYTKRNLLLAVGKIVAPI
jgi:WD40 repeat protein